MKLNKLTIRVIPPRPFPSQAVSGIWPRHFGFRYFSHTLLPAPRRGQCPVRPQVVCPTAGSEKSELLDSVLGLVLQPVTAVTALAASPEAEGECLTGTEGVRLAGRSNPGSAEPGEGPPAPGPLSTRRARGWPLRSSFSAAKREGGRHGGSLRLLLSGTAALTASSGGCTSPFCSFPLPRSGSWCGTSSGLL